MIVMPVFDVLEEAIDHRRRDHVAHILRHPTVVTLEGHAHHFAVLQHRPARVARIDRRINLNGQMRIHARVAVRAEVDARNHTACDRDALAANRVADHAHLRVQLWDAAQLEGAQLVEVRAIDCLYNRQVAVMRDVNDARRMRRWIVRRANDDACGIAHHVSVRQEAILPNHEARARSARRLTRIPRLPVIGEDHRDINLHDVIRIPRRHVNGLRRARQRTRPRPCAGVIARASLRRLILSNGQTETTQGDESEKSGG